MTTCQQPGNKYDLEKVRDYPNDLLHDYMCKRPDSVQDLLTVAKKWVDADETNQ
jgi:hypothetical protein